MLSTVSVPSRLKLGRNWNGTFLNLPYNMKCILLFLLTTFLFSAATDGAECVEGWLPYKDKLCIKAFTNLLTYDEAKVFCSSQSNELSRATLVMVKEEDLQNLLADYTHDIFDNLWLGGRYVQAAEQFKWDDGDSLTYTNWQDGYPSNITDPGTCIELRPRNVKAAINADGKWADVVCQKRNLVMCQRAVTWTLQEVIDELMRVKADLQRTQIDLQGTQQKLAFTEETLFVTRMDLQTTQQSLQATKDDLDVTQLDLEATQDDLRATKQTLQVTREDLHVVSARVVPVGSLYVEHYGQASPRTLWPDLTWEDVSSLYAGLFFRVAGGGAGEWGANQDECGPRITQMQYTYTSTDEYPHSITIPSNGWSEYGYAGRYYYEESSAALRCEGLQFSTESCELRPRNQAVRIWKRVA